MFMSVIPKLTKPVSIYTTKNDLTYPQIEKPRDENEKFWNNFISQKVRNELKIDDKCTDADVNYTVRFCNKYLIAIDKGEILLSVRSTSWIFK